MSIFGGIFGVGSGGAGAETFLELTDTPADYTAAGEAVLRVKTAADGVQFATTASTGVSIDDNNRMNIDFSSGAGQPAGLTVLNDSDGMNVELLGTFPQLFMTQTNAAANKKKWQFLITNEVFFWGIANDAGNGAEFMKVTRSLNGTLPVIDSLIFPLGNVVVGADAPGLSRFEVRKSMGWVPVFVTANADTSDAVIHQATVTNVTITVLTAHIVLGRIFIFKDSSGLASVQDPITIVTEGAQQIDGVDDVKITAPYGVIRLYAGDANTLFSF